MPGPTTSDRSSLLASPTTPTPPTPSCSGACGQTPTTSSNLTLIRWIWKRTARTTSSGSTTRWCPSKAALWTSKLRSRGSSCWGKRICNWKCCLPTQPWLGKTTEIHWIRQKRAEIFLIYRVNDRLDTATFSSRLCGYHSPSEPLTFLSSGNVMLVTMATNDKKNYPGFRAQVSQVKRGSPGKTASSVSDEWSSLQPYRCSQYMSDNSFNPWRDVVYTETLCGGQLSGENGKFTSPNFPNYYPPRINCHWTIKVSLLEKQKNNYHTNIWSLNDVTCQSLKYDWFLDGLKEQFHFIPTDPL